MSDKRSSLDLVSNLGDTPTRNFVLNKQRSHELAPISDVDPELSLDETSYKQKKPRSFNSFLSMNRSTNDDENSGTGMRNWFRKNQNSQHIIRPLSEFYDKYLNQEEKKITATHIAISPDGQYICTFDSSKYLLVSCRSYISLY